MASIEVVKAVVNQGADALLAAPTATVHEDAGKVPVQPTIEGARNVGLGIVAIAQSLENLDVNGVEAKTTESRFLFNEVLKGSERKEADDLLAAANGLVDGRQGVRALQADRLAMLEKLEEIRQTYGLLMQELGELAAMQTVVQGNAEALMHNAAQTETDARNLAASW